MDYGLPQLDIEQAATDRLAELTEAQRTVLLSAALTDFGTAQCLLVVYGGRIAYTPARDQWWYREQERWVWVSEKYIFDLAHVVLRMRLALYEDDKQSVTTQRAVEVMRQFLTDPVRPVYGARFMLLLLT